MTIWIAWNPLIEKALRARYKELVNEEIQELQDTDKVGLGTYIGSSILNSEHAEKLAAEFGDDISIMYEPTKCYDTEEPTLDLKAEVPAADAAVEIKL